jgi:hypothetical protein
MQYEYKNTRRYTMYNKFKKLVSTVSIFTITLGIVGSVFAANYTPLGYKQKYYYSNVVA